MASQITVNVQHARTGEQRAGQDKDKKEILQAWQDETTHASILHKKATQ
jgi:hypothetical protein